MSQSSGAWKIYSISGRSGSGQFGGREVRAQGEEDLRQRLAELGITEYRIIGQRPDPDGRLLPIIIVVCAVVGSLALVRMLGNPDPILVTISRPAPPLPPPEPRALCEAPVPQGVRCDRFELQITQDGDDLSVRVDTDLPEAALAFVTVSRVYREVGSSDRYSCDYLQRQVTVAEARQGISTSITDDRWAKNLRAKQVEMAGHGLGFQVDSSSIGSARRPSCRTPATKGSRLWRQ